MNVIDRITTAQVIDKNSTEWNYDLIRNIEDGLHRAEVSIKIASQQLQQKHK